MLLKIRQQKKRSNTSEFAGQSGVQPRTLQGVVHCTVLTFSTIKEKLHETVAGEA